MIYPADEVDKMVDKFIREGQEAEEGGKSKEGMFSLFNKTNFFRFLISLLLNAI